jgi:hypothetical protein
LREGAERKEARIGNATNLFEDYASDLTESSTSKLTSWVVDPVASAWRGDDAMRKAAGQWRWKSLIWDRGSKEGRSFALPLQNGYPDACLVYDVDLKAFKLNTYHAEEEL